MVKFITKSVCMALIAMLCVGSLNAQEMQRTKVQKLQELKQMAAQQRSESFVLSSAKHNLHREPVRGTFFEDVESHTDFTVNSTVNGWSYIDGDGSITYGFTTVDFPNGYDPMAFIVFNPAATTPPMSSDANIQPHSGQRFFASFAAVMPGDGGSGPNNDWLISPLLAEPSHISFWAKSYTAQYGLERMKVGYSTTETNQSDFTFVTGASYVTVPATAWTFYEYDIPAGAKYVAINCVSADAFVFMVDDITITTSGTTPDCPEVTNLAAELQGADVKLTWTAATGEPTGYKVYDGTTLLGTVTTTEYVAHNLSAGEHTLGVEATYSDGCAPVKVTITVTVLPTLPPVKNLNGNCDDGTLTLTWTEPDPNGGAVSEWVTYGTSDYYGGVGVGGPVDLTWAQRWSPADLATLGITTGSEVTKMKFVFSNFTSPEKPLGIIAADYYLKIWQGASSTSAGTEKLSQQVPFNSLVTGDWNEFTLDTPVEIDASLELWIGIRTNMTEGDGSPAANESGPFVQGVNMLYYSGSWSKIETLIPAMTGNWMVAALVEGEGGESVALSNYDIYQDDVKIDNIDAPATTYTKTDMPDGESTYCVVAVYENDAQSEKVCKTVLCGEGECLPATITTTLVGDDAVKIDWTYASKRDIATITQGGDPSGNAVGAGTSSLGVYHRFTPEDLAFVNGGKLTQFIFSPSYSEGQGEPGHTYSIRIYQGGHWGEVGQRSPGTQIYNQDLDNADLDWYSMENTITLTTPLIIDASQELWLGYHCTNIPSAPGDPGQNDGKFPAGTDSGPTKEGLGNVTNLGGWRTLTEASNGTITENWVIKGLVEYTPPTPPTVDLYRDGSILKAGYEGTTYTDGNLEKETTYCYYLIVNCPSGSTSEKSNEECETTPPGQGIAEFANSIAIYPNPTTGTITITADNSTFSKVEIYNTVGQLIETKTVQQFDISSYSNGVYLFKVYDEYNNSVTKRVMVTK